MNEVYRNISVVFEIERAVKYLRLGLAEIQKISPANDFYDPVFIYLSGGLERLFKTMLCLDFKEQNDRLPNTNEIWNNTNGHDIEFLKSKIEKICVPISGTFAKMDFEIIANDNFINSVCKVLSEFGSKSRYFNLDAILGVEQNFDSQKAWESLETGISKEIYGEKFFKLLSKPHNIDMIYNASNKEFVIRLELFFRALTRQFVFGNFYSDSKTFWFKIDEFCYIDDNQLGKTDYSVFKNHEQIKRKN